MNVVARVCGPVLQQLARENPALLLRNDVRGFASMASTVSSAFRATACAQRHATHSV